MVERFLTFDIFLYLVKLDVLRIDESPPAPLLTVLAGPKAKMGEIPERYNLREEFWKTHLEKSRQKTKLFAGVSPRRDCYICTGAGISGVSYCQVIWIRGARVELFIDTGDKTRNKQIYDALCEKKSEIEADVGHELEWHRLEDRRLSRIAYLIKNG